VSRPFSACFGELVSWHADAWRGIIRADDSAAEYEVRHWPDREPAPRLGQRVEFEIATGYDLPTARVRHVLPDLS
jgi:hypothetical protein